LAQRITEEGWPHDWVINVPTASGKTSLLDIAVFALAGQAGRNAGERTAPLRTFFVVDRRLVVDDVSRHAEKLRHALNSDSRVLAEVKERLSGFGSGCPLQVATLRGGMYRSSTWADMPNQPLLCVSTVDQVGSRLLFRGYGVSEKRRSVDAALVGCDSLIIVDEAHLSAPFLQTARWVQKYAGWGECRPPTARLIEMSATAKGKEGFVLSEEDYSDKALAPRLDARKMAELRESADVEGEAAAAARRLAAKPLTNVVGIVLNTVDAARSVFERLNADGNQAILLIGRTRPYDRDRLLGEFLPRIRVGRDRGKDRRLFVVATQTVEVGADLDFDALVSEVAALDALRQRFGRLDRLGELKSTEAVILRRKRRKGEADRIYGEAADRSWEWLNSQARRDGAGPVIDFGARRMTELHDLQKPDRVSTNAGQAPILMPAHVETWIQTYPTPDPDPEVAPFLHGLDATSADVNLVWRADLGRPVGEEWLNILQSAPPLTAEALPVPIWVAAGWLRRQRPIQFSDLEGAGEPGGEKEQSVGEREEREFLIWRGPEDSRVGKVGDIRPGDTLVVRSDEGGADDYGWSPESRLAVTDIGNECAARRAEEAGGHYIVRVHPEVLFPAGTAAGEDYAERRDALRRDLEQWRTEEDEDARGALLDLVQRVAPRPKRSDWTVSAIYGNVVFRTRWMKPVAGMHSPDMETDETDEDDSSSLTVLVPLETHVAGVSKWVCRFAAGCGVHSEIAEVLRRAAELHDLGKCDERFQMMLDPGRSNGLLAKGDGSSRAGYESRRRLAGYPRGARHEIWSVALAQKAPSLAHHASRDLILYLIGTHHGHGRPFIPVWKEKEDIVIADEHHGVWADGSEVESLWRFGSGWVDRFWGLNRKHGYWGLAYLEAILRRADCVQSRREQENDGQA
jgi:CRISPR-associated endonuclease/helicase Cas3